MHMMGGVNISPQFNSGTWVIIVCTLHKMTHGFCFGIDHAHAVVFGSMKHVTNRGVSLVLVS